MTPAQEKIDQELRDAADRAKMSVHPAMDISGLFIMGAKWQAERDREIIEKVKREITAAVNYLENAGYVGSKIYSSEEKMLNDFKKLLKELEERK